MQADLNYILNCSPIAFFFVFFFFFRSCALIIFYCLSCHLTNYSLFIFDITFSVNFFPYCYLCCYSMLLATVFCSRKYCCNFFFLFFYHLLDFFLHCYSLCYDATSLLHIVYFVLQTIFLVRSLSLFVMCWLVV